MPEEKSQNYSLFPGSRLVWFHDGSGVAIYSGYSGDTTFLNNKKPDIVYSEFPISSSNLAKADLIKYLNLGEESAKSVIQRLLSEKVLWAN
ncbi:hypothetical protein [Aliiglaciecola lipolytica]|uniref:Uncharacterized protein n=1 Tax=Aliiglaciecola lipolytica E3 TaxID=1127673 RepID=K6XMG6_9ALTE|nr:hypothetical protein [Aliiglaciecola lipolytica]GAC12851.1 hypothetical protein GLIP_0197 [Aliiglaciecola lipolytica E3]